LRERCTQQETKQARRIRGSFVIPRKDNIFPQKQQEEGEKEKESKKEEQRKHNNAYYTEGYHSCRRRCQSWSESQNCQGARRNSGEE